MSINPILLQKSIRDNAADLHDFSKDLKSWGEEMKRKEEALKNDKTSLNSKTVNKDPKSTKKFKLTDKLKKPATKLGATDYAAWDKFDADAELERLEEDIPDDSDLTDECNENMIDESIVEKEKGNQFVKNQKWEEAIKCYTKAIKCYSYDPIFYANRALCYLKLNKFEECEKDCDLSLKLDDTYVKAYQRRAACRIKLSKFEHAEVDLKKVLILEPKNKEAKAELDKLSILLKRNIDVADPRPISKFTASRNKSNSSINLKPFTPIYKPPKEQEVNEVPQQIIDDSTPIPQWVSDPEIIEVKPIQKPPHLRSKKPLKRIKITEIGDTHTKIDVSKPVSKEAVKQHVLEKKENDNKQGSITTRPISAFKKDRKEKFIQEADNYLNESQDSPTQISLDSVKTAEKNFNSESITKPEPNLHHLKIEDLNVIEKINPMSTAKDVKNSVNDTKKLIENNEINTSFKCPKNAVQFYTSWKNFRTTEEKYTYLKLIGFQDIPKIFLNSLDSAVFSNILEVLVKHFIGNNDKLYDILNSFTEVKRFSAITMFLSGEDKSNVWKLLDHIKECKEREKDDVDKLIAKYEL
ncbi:RNA polymerase II-associated protein 3 [Diabrotica undecimpunctata]|uniref:RNA polymerase II-associated protein 3 n=1 Tax=Diabrotica undecimpunctata TaxID=50387 RepID=UPI003B641023